MSAAKVVSLQVSQEYFVTVTRWLQVDPKITRRKVDDVRTENPFI